MSDISAIVQEELLPRVVDAVSGGNFIGTRVLTNMKDFRTIKLGKAFRYQNAGNGKTFSGLETFNTNQVPTKERLRFSPKQMEQPVVISGIDKDMAESSKTSDLDLSALALEEAGVEMANNFGTIIYSDGKGSYSSGAVVADDSYKNFLGLAGIVDDGTELATYGEQSRSTYSVLNATRTDLSGALTKATMQTMHNSVTEGSDEPNLIVTTKAIWNDYEDLLTTTVEIDGYKKIGAKEMGPGLSGDLGYRTIHFKGIPMVADPKCPTGRMYFLNEKYLEFYGLPATVNGYKSINLNNRQLEGYYRNDHGDKLSLGFSASDMVVPTNQYGEIGHLLLQGNLISWFPQRQGVIIGIT